MDNTNRFLANLLYLFYLNSSFMLPEEFVAQLKHVCATGEVLDDNVQIDLVDNDGNARPITTYNKVLMDPEEQQREQ